MNATRRVIATAGWRRLAPPDRDCVREDCTKQATTDITFLGQPAVIRPSNARPDDVRVPS